MTDKDKEKEKATPEQRREIWAELSEQFRELEQKWHEEWTRQVKEIMDEPFKKLREYMDNPPPYTLSEMLKLIWTVEDRSPGAGEAIKLLIQRYFQRRRVLFIAEERIRLEELWKLELSPDGHGDFTTLSYERDVAPLPLLEAIEISGDYPLPDVKNLIRKDMRNRIVRGGSQGRNIDTKEVGREYRLKEFGDPDNSHEIRPNLSKWNDKEKLFERADKYRNPEYLLQYTTEASPGFSPHPWESTWKVRGISDEDRPVWEVVYKAISTLDGVDQALIQSIMFKIPMSLLSKETGISQGTLRSRKFRLMAILKESATKSPSSSVSYIGKNSSSQNRAKPTKKWTLGGQEK